jgi:hypothetical protein
LVAKRYKKKFHVIMATAGSLKLSSFVSSWKWKLKFEGEFSGTDVPS